MNQALTPLNDSLLISAVYVPNFKARILIVNGLPNIRNR